MARNDLPPEKAFIEPCELQWPGRIEDRARKLYVRPTRHVRSIADGAARSLVGRNYRGAMTTPSMADFEALDVRIGTVVRAEANTGSRDPALALWIDLGEDGVVQSSAKVTDRYTPSDLVDRQVVVVCGFDSIRVGGFRSDVLVLGALTHDGVVLLGPDEGVEPGSTVA